MKKLFYVGLIPVAALSLIAGPQLASKTEPSGPVKSELEVLKGKVEQLERKTAELEKQLKELRQQQRVISAVSQNSSTGPLVVNPGSNVPPGWTPRQFNGQTYYLVPLGQDAEHAPAK